MSKNQEFINEFICYDYSSRDYYDGVLEEVQKKIFEVLTESKKPIKVYEDSTYNERFDCCDIALHPLQKIYVINDTTSSYDNGAFEFDYQFAFKYKEKYYHFISYGGN